MYANNLEQLLHFLYFMIVGIILSIIFDIFRILRRSFKTTDMITNLEDAIFGFITGVILLASIFWFNNGQLRFYILISIVTGIFLYMLFISKYFISLSVTIINIIKKFILFILYPFNILGKWIKKIIFNPILFVFVNLRQYTRKIHMKLKKISKRQKKNIHKEGF